MHSNSSWQLVSHTEVYLVSADLGFVRALTFYLTSMLSLAQVREETEHPWSIMNYFVFSISTHLHNSVS